MKNNFLASFSNLTPYRIRSSTSKKCYRSLWAISEGRRKPSPLADIPIAICMQYGMARLPSVERGLEATSKANVTRLDAMIAGQWYHRRC